MSKAAAWSVPSSWAIAVAMAGRLEQVADGRDDRRSRSARASMPARSSALRAAATDIICTVSSGVAQRRCLMPGALLDPLVAGVDRVDDLGVGDDPRRAGRRRSRGCAACGAPWEPLDRGHQAAPSGCRRTSGWPGETRSPSSTSHSTTWPPCGGDDAGAVAQAGDVADRWRRRRARRRRRPRRRRWKVPLAGETTIRQVGVVSIVRGLAVLGAEGAGVVELVGGLERERLDALAARAWRCRSGCRPAASRGCR